MSKLVALISLCFILLGCGRSKEAQFYVLNPIPPAKENHHPYRELRIGIDEVSTPGYVERPQLMIHFTPYRMKMEEFHQWAEALNKNITRVIETNISTLLPGAVVESLPWDNQFRPNYHLQVEITQLDIDFQGNSVLRAEYLIYNDHDLISKQNIYYHQKVQIINVESLVSSVNSNVTRLSRDIAQSFRRIH
nr:hypothetical protein [Legionella jordanis]